MCWLRGAAWWCKVVGRVPLCIVVFLALSTPSPAQQTDLDALALKLAEGLGKSARASVVVVDLVGPDGHSSPLGTWLADQFAMALARAAGNLKLIDRARLKKASDKHKLSSEVFEMRENAPLLKKFLGAEIVIRGIYGAAENGLEVALVAQKVSSPDIDIAAASGRIPLSREAELSHGAPVTGFPSCEQCPPPEYPQGMRGQNAKSVVVLEVVITPEGRATNITVKKSAGKEFDEKAMEVVKKWKLKPAIGPGGRPVAVRTVIEITFRLQ